MTLDPAPEFKSEWTEARGLRIHARVSAGHDGRRAVVLLHGYGGSGSYMLPIARRLVPHYAVFVPDLPGHGPTPRADHILTMPELAEALYAWMIAAGLGQSALIANSMGCQIIAHLAHRHPEAAAALVMIGPTPDPSARKLRNLVPRFAAGGAFERPSLNLVLMRDYARAGLGLLRQELRHMLADEIEHVLPHVRVPALVVRGARDTIVSQDWAERVTRLLRAELRVVPRWGHALNYSAPDELHAVVRPFLARSLAPAAQDM